MVLHIIVYIGHTGALGHVKGLCNLSLSTKLDLVVVGDGFLVLCTGSDVTPGDEPKQNH